MVLHDAGAPEAADTPAAEGELSFQVSDSDSGKAMAEKVINRLKELNAWLEGVVTYWDNMAGGGAGAGGGEDAGADGDGAEAADGADAETADGADAAGEETEDAAADTDAADAGADGDGAEA